jgi:hypothetical protein
MSFFTAWMNSFKGKCKFDESLFAMTPHERVLEFGDDPVEDLRAMSIQERIEMYGRDYEEFLNPKQ